MNRLGLGDIVGARFSFPRIRTRHDEIERSKDVENRYEVDVRRSEIK